MKASPFVLAVAVGGLACGQVFEIHGMITEGADGPGVVGVEVKLTEVRSSETPARKLLSTTFTDAGGAFKFPSLHAGTYHVEAQKAGYDPGSGNGAITFTDRTDANVVLVVQQPSWTLSFSMIRTGTITGRLLDENRQPVPGLRVAVQEPMKGDEWAELSAESDQDGNFTVAGVPPGSFLLRVSPRAGEYESVQAQFTAQEAADAKQDYDTSYTPVTLRSGGSVNVGTLSLRTAPYYSVRVAVPDCYEGEVRKLIVVRPGQSFGHSSQVPCATDLLVKNLSPGSYWLQLSSNRRGEVPDRWAIASVEIVRENVAISMATSTGMEIRGRLTAADGAKLPNSPFLSINLHPEIDVQLEGVNAVPDAQGNFTIKTPPWSRLRVSIQPLPSTHYVREIRYGGRPIQNGAIVPVPGAELVIQLDDRPAILRGIVDEAPLGTRLIVMKWPLPPPIERLRGTVCPVLPNEQFECRMPPGEYRIAPVRPNSRVNVRDSTFLELLMGNSETIRLQRGETRSLSLRLR